MNLPTLRQLEYALAVAETKHFGRAAAACHVTQPALSAQVKELEGLLGARLFERDRRRVLLTPAGERVVAAARPVVDGVRALVEAARGGGRPLARMLRLGAIPTVGPFLLPRALPAIRRKHADLRLLLREEKTQDLLAMLASAELDVALLALPVRAKGIATRVVSADRLLVAMPRGHALASRRALRESDLVGEEVLLLEEGHCLRDQALEACRAARATERPDYRGTSLVTLLQVVAGGAGITFVPEIASGALPRSSVVTVPLQGPRSTRQLALAWRESDPARAEYELLAKELAAALEATA